MPSEPRHNGLDSDKDQVDLILHQWERERPDLQISAMGVIGRIVRLSRYLERELELPYREAGLDFGLFDVLATLRRAGPPYRLSPRVLNHWCMLSSGAMTARLDRLENAGLIARRPDPDDRRGLLIELSPAGFRLIDRLVEDHVANEEQLLAGIRGSERVELGRLLRVLLIGFENRTGDRQVVAAGEPSP